MHVPVKKLVCNEIFAWAEINKVFIKTKENGENIPHGEHLVEELQKYPCLDEKRN